MERVVKEYESIIVDYESKLDPKRAACKLVKRAIFDVIEFSHNCGDVFWNAHNILTKNTQSCFYPACLTLS